MIQPTAAMFRINFKTPHVIEINASKSFFIVLEILLSCHCYLRDVKTDNVG